MVDDEVQLIRLAQQGDAEACACLYDRHYDAVYRYCYYRLADVELAQDVTADVFVRMVEKLDCFQIRGRPFLAWLYTIARNLVTDVHRDNGKMPQVELDEASHLSAGGSKELARAVDQRLEAECLAAAMEHLTEDQRTVVVLKFMEDLSNAQVAHLLDKTEGSVKSLQHRALRALRRALKREGCHEN
jgi:RNA polymerase sigma-70 factor (ECF subfamily)